ncbi:MAG: rhodanese-like domain-containing protein [Elusimicrobia bacterium]|nr:rhodanese-like domain-containing protein [Elusimicrobiota bacterium]
MATTRETARAAEPGAADYLSAKLDYEIAPSDLKALLDRDQNAVFLLDIRAPGAYADGHVPGARNVPLERLGASYGELPRRTLIVTYCEDLTCGLSLLAAMELAGTGFKVKRLLGGMEGWRRKGYPVEPMPPAPAPEY